MIEDNSLMLVQRDSPLADAVGFSTEAATMKAEALEKSALIFKVEDAKSQQIAVDAQAALMKVIRAVEKARKVVKEPILAIYREIDRRAAEFVAELDEEGNRIGALLNTFQEKERARIAAEARLQDASLTRLDREEAEKIACAATITEQDSIRDEYSQKRRMTVSMVDPIPKARGQMTKPDYEVTVVDAHELYRFHPNCVTLTPILTEIKALIAGGVKVRGATWKEVVRSTVRTAKPEPPIPIQ